VGEKGYSLKEKIHMGSKEMKYLQSWMREIDPIASEANKKGGKNIQEKRSWKRGMSYDGCGETNLSIKGGKKTVP